MKGDHDGMDGLAALDKKTVPMVIPMTPGYFSAKIMIFFNKSVSMLLPLSYLPVLSDICVLIE